MADLSFLVTTNTGSLSRQGGSNHLGLSFVRVANFLSAELDQEWSEPGGS